MSEASKSQSENRKELTFLEHLDELRSRLIKAVLILSAGFLVCYFFTSAILDFLLEPFKNSGSSHLTLLTPTEGFLVKLKVALLAGLVVSSPGIFYQFWKFIAPGLYEKERRMIFPVVFWSVVLFLIGAYFCYWMLPFALAFFQSFAMENVENFWSLSKYLSLVTFMLLAFGLVFELPLIIYYAARMGLLTPEFLRKKRRHAIVILLIIAAIVTPPDIFTMLMLSGPLIILYEISIFLAVIAYKKRLKSAQKNKQ